MSAASYSPSSPPSHPSSASSILLPHLHEAYRVLEITSTANTDEIKSAYKRLALKSHPDKNPHDPLAHSKFVKIYEAYKQISTSSSLTTHSSTSYLDESEEEEEEDGDECEEDDDCDDEIDRHRHHRHRHDHHDHHDLNSNSNSSSSSSSQHDHGFAFKMFEKMFFGTGTGNKMKGRKISGGFMFSSRHECDCPHCRCYSKPKAPYIPKSQRPKDPPSSSSTNETTAGVGASGGGTVIGVVDDWLEDLDDQKKRTKKSNKVNTKKNKSSPKKKVLRGQLLPPFHSPSSLLALTLVLYTEPQIIPPEKTLENEKTMTAPTGLSSSLSPSPHRPPSFLYRDSICSEERRIKINF
jgi:curved DNA-binding protein CbpA